jgi:hypothetical protein
MGRLSQGRGLCTPCQNERKEEQNTMKNNGKMIRLNAKTYGPLVEQELNKILDLMHREWGYKPNLAVSVQPAVIVQVDFNMKGFAHKGRQIWVRQGNLHRRNPRRVAMEICREISQHRNTCADCGEGIASLYTRASYDPSHYWGNSPVRKGYVRGYDYDKVTKKVRHPLLKLNVLPDAVEKLLEPRRSKLAEKRIMALPPEERQTIKCSKK